jgi:Lysyl oxidase
MLTGTACSTGGAEEPTQSRRASDPPMVEASRPPSEVATELLPDLRQEPPAGLVVTRAGTRFRLGFDSAATNVGGGPLTIVGSRPNRWTATMEASQVIPLEDGGTRHQRSVGVLRYVTSPDHSHWHLVPFMKYELRRATDLARAARDRKTGFCLGDRYDAEMKLPGKSPEKVFRSRCGLGKHRVLRLREGISVGYGDDYDANLEGQYLGITGIPAGRYFLVHRVNADRRLLERSYVNNVAWVLVRISWSRGAPNVAVLRRCDPGRSPSGCELQTSLAE